MVQSLDHSLESSVGALLQAFQIHAHLYPLVSLRVPHYVKLLHLIGFLCHVIDLASVDYLCPTHLFLLFLYHYILTQGTLAFMLMTVFGLHFLFNFDLQEFIFAFRHHGEDIYEATLQKLQSGGNGPRTTDSRKIDAAAASDNANVDKILREIRFLLLAIHSGLP